MRNHLYHLLHEAERRVQELGSSLRLNIESDGSSLSSSSSNIPSITVGDSSQNKTYSIWERRAKGLKRMLMGFEQISKIRFSVKFKIAREQVVNEFDFRTAGSASQRYHRGDQRIVHYGILSRKRK